MTSKTEKEKRVMLAARVEKDISDNLDLVARKSGIPKTRLVERCLANQNLLRVVEEEIAAAKAGLESLQQAKE